MLDGFIELLDMARKQVVLLMLLLAACSSEGDRKIRETEQALRDASRNPDSVEFRDMTYADTGRTRWVCGQMNGENGLGGMTGFQSFVVSADGDGVWFEGQDGFSSMSDYCDGKPGA